jgi:hypothetical protein
MATPKLTLPEIVQRYPADWRALSPQQGDFVIAYISGGLANGKYDAKAAAQFAYPRVKRIGIWANRLQATRRVMRILALHQGLTEGEVLLAEVRAIIQKVRRDGSNPNVLISPLLQVAAALKAYVAKENS